uniref:NADH-ubiquinone oxidoreductase chain 2 n=1 Tax=Dermanyssus gallinae TaxID=34641 RepID=A0A7U3PYL9_9ACAR|nr:NADH dehydrogenase subunit 2 [Dermanyssus gallinae]QPG86050.1 NADH dehydrogenase subunit 2 [Dermanyssus gallinae]
MSSMLMYIFYSIKMILLSDMLIIKFSWIQFISMNTLLFSVFMVFSLGNMFFIWIMIEINLISFLMMMYTGKNISINSMIKYFLIQTIGSLFFLFFSLMHSNILMLEINKIMVVMIMMFKLGIFPFSFWLNDFIEGLEWNNFFIFNIFQKIIPLWIIYKLDFFYMDLFIFMNSIYMMIMMYNQVSIRKLFMYSSYVNMSWIFIFSFQNEWLWMIYYMIYIMMMYMLVELMNLYKMNSIYQLKFLNFKMKMYFMLLMFLMGGLPPFMFMFSKMMSILLFNESFSFIILMIVIMFNMYVYMNLSVYTMMHYNVLFKINMIKLMKMILFFVGIMLFLM